MVGKKIYMLCIDDDETVLTSLKAELSQAFEADFPIEWANSGAEGLEIVEEMAARDFEPVVVLCDYIMPGMKGDQVLEKIHQRYPETKNILLTGQATAEGIGRAVNLANLYRYVSKPWQRDDLVMTIRSAWQLFNQGRQIAVQNKELQALNGQLASLLKEREQDLAEREASLRQRMRELSALNRMANKLSVNQQGETIIQMIGDDLFALLGLQNVMISLAAPARDGVQVVYNRGDLPNWTKGAAHGDFLPFAENPALAEVFASKLPASFREGDSWKNIPNAEAYLKMRGAATALIVPLISWSEVIGLLVLERTSQDYFFAALELALAETVAGLLAGALETARLFGEERRARDAADQANRAKSQFLANMSHEIRTPMNAILGFTQILLHTEGLAEEAREHLQIIQSSGHHLLTIINDVLDMAKIEAGKFTLNKQSFDFQAMFDSLKALFQLQAVKRSLALDFIVDPQVPRFLTSDEGKLKQVLINLVNNALKFTLEGGIKIICRPVADTGRLEIEVSDTGRGIPAYAIDHVFDAFFQISGSNAGLVEGTGLGLAISKKIVEALGGQIRVESEVGKGTRFLFDFQVDFLSGADLKTADSGRTVIGLAPGATPRRVLIVEDNRDNRMLLREMFHRVDFEVAEAENGQQALLQAEKSPPDLILLDLRMPVMNGIEFARKIRQKPATSQVRIIALTAATIIPEEFDGYKDLCNDILGKPFSETELYQRVEQLLSVQFAYKENPDGEALDPDSLPPQHLLTPTALETLPRAWRKKFRLALEAFNAETLATILQELPPEFGAYRSAFEKLVLNMDHSYLMEILRDEA